MKSNSIKYIFLINVFFLMECRFVYCLDPGKKISQYIHTIWTIKDGLPQNSIRAIAQTPDGYIWIGSQEGLTRFDGVRFKTFNKYNNDHLKTNWIGSLYVSQDSSLWVGNYGYGISRLRANQWRFYSKNDGLISDIVPSFVEDRKNNMWIVTNRGIVISRTKDSEQIFEYKETLPKLTTHILIDQKNNKWIITTDQIYLYGDDNQTIPIDINRSITVSENNSYAVDASQRLWVATDNSIICYDLQSRALVQNIRWPRQSLYGKKTMITDKHGSLWIGTTGYGLYRLHNGKWSLFTEKDGLSNNYVLAFLEDFEGNIWVGTDDGLNKFSDGLITTFSQTEGLSNNSVTSLCEDSSGSVWIGTRSGLNKLTDDQILYPGNHVNVKKSYFWTLICDPSGHVWAADVSDNIYKFSGNNLTIFRLSYQQKDREITRLKEIEVNTLHKSKNGHIWLGTRYGLFEIVNDHFIEYSMVKDQMPIGSLISILETNGNNFFISTSTGGFIRFKDNRYAYTPVFYDSVKVIFSTNYVDKDGYIWIGSFESGLYRYARNAWAHYTQKDGLFSNSIFSILEDDDGCLWMSSNYGISKVSKKELNEYAEGRISKITSVHYTETDGMKTSECNGGAGPNGLKTRDGRLFFSTNKGVAVIKPKNSFVNHRPPNVIIEKLIADQKDLNAENSVIIEAGTRNIEILYTALSFIAPEKVLFKYRLKGMDDEWISVGTRRIAYFNNLVPGNYIFQVVACNNNGVWNETGAEIHLYVKPFFYQTYWFYGILIILTFTAILAVYSWRIRTIKKRQLLLESVIAERTKEIKIKNEQLERQSGQLQELDQFKTRFFINISHEFRTPLTLILGPVEALIEKESQAKKRSHLLLIKKNARRLLKLINELLDIAKLDSRKIHLRVARLDVINLTKIIISSFESVLKQKNISIQFFSSVPVIQIYIDADVYEKIIVNLISNAYKFTPDHGTIFISFENFSATNLDFIEIRIKDTGIGISEDNLSKIFDRFYQVDNPAGSESMGSGIGLALAKELIQLHHGKIEVTSKPGQGTEFTILLPKIEEYFRTDVILSESSLVSHVKTFEEDLFIDEIEDENIIQDESEQSTDNRLTVLVVEDNNDVRKYLRECLQDEYRIIESENGLDGFHCAVTDIPDLVVSDVMMPVIDGFKFAKKIREDNRTSHIPIVLLTAKGDDASRLEGLAIGVDDYLIKPFNRIELLIRINNLISIRRKLQEKYQKYIHLEPSAIHVESLDEHFIKQAMEIIEANLEDPAFDIEKFSKSMAVSRAQLYRKVKALINKSPNELIRVIRLKRAAQLLKAKSGNVTEIAYQVGFNNLSYFAKCFKEEYGVLPSDYA